MTQFHIFMIICEITIYYVNIYISKIFYSQALMNRSSKGIKLVFASQRTDNITPDVLVKSFWVSTALALILTLPALGVFITVFQSSGNMLIGSIVGFCIHFIILSKSEKISTALTSLFDN
jgi:hypothetical protein